MNFNPSSYATGIAVGEVIGLSLGMALSEIEPINWKCKKCNHSWKKHRKGWCESGLITKCNCNKFELDKEQVVKAEKELNEMKEKLFEDLEKAKEIMVVKEV